MGFNRRTDDPVNAALDYGYSILLSTVAKEITVSGYIPQLGIFHENRFNPWNLASDLMEPFRPFVDVLVYKMLPFPSLEREQKRILVQMLNRKIRIDGKENTLVGAVKVYVRSAQEALDKGDITEVRFPAYELQIYENVGVF